MSKNIDFTLLENTLRVDIHKSFLELDTIKHFIRNGFDEFFFGQREIIIFNLQRSSKKELENRKILIELLYKESKTEDLKYKLDDLLGHYKKKIHIKFSRIMASDQIVTVVLKKYIFDIYHLSFENDELAIVYNFYKTRLSSYIKKAEEDKKNILLETKSYEAIDTLLHMLEKENILGKHIQIKSENPSLIGDLYDDLQNYEYKMLNKELVHAFNTLELSPDIRDFKIIKQQYYKLAKEHHPDKYHSYDKQTIEEKTINFIKIKESFGYIKEYLNQG